MQFKSFSFGLGLGIVFSSLLFLFVSNINTNKNKVETNDNNQINISNEEIEERAKEMGMVYLNELPEKETVIEITSNDYLEENKENVLDDVKEADANENDSINVITVTIDRGSNATQVARKLYEAGIVEDKDAFNSYLIEKKKTTALRSGTYNIKKGLEFSEIADILTKNPDN